MSQILKNMLDKYKLFEKCFLKADKTKDMMTYVKLKHQFRAMVAFLSLAMVPTIIVMIMNRMVVGFVPLMLLAVLIGFRTESYNAIRLSFFLLMTIIPLRYPSTNFVLSVPLAILLTNMQILIQVQSVGLMVLHIVVQGVAFYFYGIDSMVLNLKAMSAEEIVESAKTAVVYSFAAVIGNSVCLKLFYSQFSSLLRKVNTLTENISKVNNQLNDQNIKLQSNLEMKDVFIYTFSHELKNALNGLLGNLYLACDTAKDFQVLQFLSSAKVCGEVLKNFVHNILDSGKLENGNLEVSPERKNVMALLQNIWTICGRIIQNKRLEGFLEVEKNVPRLLELDEQRMIQIMLNLVSNAVKFTEKGYVRLRVCWQTISTSCSQPETLEERGNLILDSNRSDQELIREERKAEETVVFGDMREFSDTLEEEASQSKKEKPHLVTEYQKKFIAGSQLYQLNLTKLYWESDEVLQSILPKGSKGILKIQVVDSGCGMTTEDQSLLFRKFSQVSSIEGQRKVGTGLGLWICKELAHRLDGDITTRSKVGVGSVFELTVRTKVPNSRNKNPRGHHSTGQGSTCNSPAKVSLEQKGPNMLKILIADDDSFNIELMKNYLDKFRISYLCAFDGEEAVSLFKKHHKEICFVITDNFMPKKTGTEAALEIAGFLEEKKQPKIPIMCISGDLNVSVGEKGITSVIQKPINFDRLKEELMLIYPQFAH